jgi:hypothetical protein
MEGSGCVGCVWIFLAIIVGAVVVLRAFDSIAGRGPKQVSDGILRTRRPEQSSPPPPPMVEDRVPCPMCAEQIMRDAKKCRFCGHELTT